jgi:hypothetical protein
MSAVHPELEDGEVWIGNILRSDFHLIGWTTKRLGKIAYLTNGKPIPKSQGFGPVFVTSEEIEAAGPLALSPTPGTIDHRWK